MSLDIPDRIQDRITYERGEILIDGNERGGICPVCLDDYDFQAKPSCQRQIDHRDEDCDCLIAVYFMESDRYRVCRWKNEAGYYQDVYVHERGGPNS